MARRRSQSWALPPALSSAQGGQSEGVFFYPVPASTRAVRESQRDFLRTLVAGGIVLLTPALLEAVWRRSDRASSVTGEVVEVVPGDVSDEAVKAAVADFREQLLDSSAHGAVAESFEAGDSFQAVAPGCSEGAEGCGKADLHAKMRAALESGVVEPQLTVGPALQFALEVGLPPRILQPRFVVVLGVQSLRVATVGFVGEPTLGDRPSEQRTPFVVRLITQNLLDVVPTPSTEGAHVCVNYRVRQAQPYEVSVEGCISTEVALIRNMTMGDAPSFSSPRVSREPQLGRVAGVSILGSVEALLDDRKDITTLFRVKVVPTDGRDAWEVFRQYQKFHDLFRVLRPARNQLAGASFPRKQLGVCSGGRLEARMRGLEAWLGKVVREAQSREPKWLRPLCDFLEVPG